MNQNEIQIESQKANFVPANDRRGVISPGARVEPREFEKLLQRAVEILSARAQSAPPYCT